ncbi:hypothetical protein E1176_13685 [Fulvivirga sp. RKSG066]|uniref:SGNH/GDSL hydrolase family protein n=1 Tax=Fulvivirga aurantia TaxID=2529383 RepID=UPI0012BBA9EA|nr:SGNH/GDSL hydrolase family protein [Fulvivirga aurantia]MTI22077.1 hypothetical protein [Fulvivirga aurantia]
MKNLNKILLYSLGLAVFSFSCDSEEDLIDQRIEENTTPEEVAVSGSADFTSYISVGNSLTAGFADAALYPEGQQYSFSSIVAGQLELAGGGSFVIPDIVSGNGFGGVDENMMIEGKSFIDIETALAAIAEVEGVEVADAIQTTEGSALTNSSNTGAALNNFGVPGARLIDLSAKGYGSLNPFYGAFQSSATASILEDAVSADGSIFTLWAGNNDVLGYAINGGAAGEDFDPMNPQTITDAGTFGAALSATLDALTANGADGILLNIPPITLIPYFQTVTNISGGVDLIPLDAQTAAFVTSNYSDYNNGLNNLAAAMVITQEEADRRQISFVEGDNPPVITDESLSDLSSFGLPSIRQAESMDLFTLTALGTIGSLQDPDDPTSVIGVGVPVPDEFTLTFDEQTNVIMAYATFNTIIATEAAARPNIHLLDIGPLFADVFGLSGAQAAALGLSAAAQSAADGELGIKVGGFDLVPLSLSQEELFNSIWSTDGVHPNPRGAAIIANEVIAKINAEFDATVPLVNVLDYPTINAK